MHANSLLGSARAIDRHLDDLLAASLLADSPAACDHAASIRATLTDVAEQLRASAPIPAAGGNDPTSGDDAVIPVLRVLVEQDDHSVAAVADRLADGETTIDRLAAADRLEVHDETLLVPLGRDPRGSNWWALLEFLRRIAADLAAKADRVRSRVLADGADEPLATAWTSIADRIRVLRQVLDTIAANGRYAGEKLAVGDARSVSFASWTAEQFGGGDVDGRQIEREPPERGQFGGER